MDPPAYYYYCRGVLLPNFTSQVLLLLSTLFFKVSLLFSLVLEQV